MSNTIAQCLFSCTGGLWALHVLQFLEKLVFTQGRTFSCTSGRQVAVRGDKESYSRKFQESLLNIANKVVKPVQKKKKIFFPFYKKSQWYTSFSLLGRKREDILVKRESNGGHPSARQGKTVFLLHSGLFFVSPRKQMVQFKQWLLPVCVVRGCPVQLIRCPASAGQHWWIMTVCLKSP